MFKKSKKRQRIESIEEVDEATSPKQPCLHDSNKVETFQNNNPLKLQYEAESLMPPSGSTDYCTQQMLLYMYKLDVSTWCYLKRRVEDKKLDGVGLTLDNKDIDKFSDIVIRQNDESIHVNVNYTVSLFSEKFITYLDLFGIKSPYSLKNYFNSWVSYELNKPKYQTSKIKYLVVFCNDKLELSEDNKLTLCSSKNSYPFQFESMDICQIPVLQDMLVTNTSCKFYKFATDDQTIDEFCQRLMLSSTNKKTFNKKCFTSEFEVHLKKSFLSKIIFLDNQPCRESLKIKLKDEIEKNEKDYIKLQNRLIKYTSIAEKSISNENFQILMSLLNDMFVHMNISAVSTKSYHTSNVINILYKKKITYLINVGSADNAKITFDDFFPKKKREKSNFSLNDLYTFFCNEYRKNSNIKFFIIYTNSELNLTHNNEIQNNKSEKYFPLKLNKIDVTKKRYKIFKNCTNLNESMLFEFASEDLDALLELLNPSNSNEQDIDAEEENNMKLLFLHTLIIVTSQKKITDIPLQNEQQQLPYNLDQLQEVTLRWLEFQKHQILTLRTMRLLLNDIKNNRNNGKYLNCSDVADEWKLTKSLCRDTPSLINEVFDFLINGEGKLFIQNFKNSGIDLRSVANVMHGVTKKNLYTALEALHNFWFDEKGNKTKNFLIYEKNHMNFKTLFTIVGKSHINAVGIIESLFDLWFDDLGNKTKYLYSLEREGIPFSMLGSMFNACGFESRLAHENLYNLLFDEQGIKTQYFINLKKNNLSLARIAPLVHSGGISCAQILKDLHDLWFDSEGNMTKYLLTLKNHNIDFYKIKETLNGSKTQAVSLYKKMYYTLFDEFGNPTQNLQNLSNAGIKFSTISKLLYSSNNNIVTLFNALYSLFFDNGGNKTVYLKTFENHNINLNDICKILKGRSVDASTTFKNFYNLLFDEKGEKKFLLKTFENYGIGIDQLAKMIRHSNAHAVNLLTDLFNLWFDENGNKSYYIKHFENVNVDLIKIMYFLRNAQKGTCRFFQVLYDFFIIENGVESFHLSTLNKHEISIDIFLNFVRGTTIDHMRTMNKVFYTFFDKEGNKTQLLCNFENKGVDLESLSNVFILCQGNGIQKFYDFFFDETDKDRETLKMFEMRNVSLLDVCNIFLKVGSSTPLFFKMLFDLWFDENLKETQYLQDLERNGITLLWLCQILRGSGIHGYEVFKGIHKLFINEDGQATLELQIVLKYINLKKLRNIYLRGGRVFLSYFPKLLTRWFDEKGEKTHFLLTMEKNNFDINLICDVLKASGGFANKFFMELYKLFFDSEDNPSSYITNYLNNPAIIKGVCKIIRGTRGKIINLLKRLYSLWFKSDGSKRNYLLTLENYGVDFVTLHGLFIGASYSLRNTFVNLFKCMFESVSKPTESVYLKSLLGIGFTVPDIISLLRKSGLNAARNFMNLYYLFFDEQGQMTKYTEVLTQNKVDIGSFVRGLNIKNGNKLVDIFKSAYELYYDENGVKIDVVVNDDCVLNIEAE